MLDAALHFNTEDLHANREGRLSVRQRNRVFARRRSVLIALAVVTLFIGVIAGMVILAVLLGAVVSEVAILLALGGEVVTVGLAYLGWSLRQNYQKFLLPGRVMRIEGPVTCYQLRERQNDKSRTGYYVRIGALEFEISDAALNAFTDGAPYIVYYVPRPFTLLSAEPAGSSS